MRPSTKAFFTHNKQRPTRTDEESFESTAEQGGLALHNENAKKKVFFLKALTLDILRFAVSDLTFNRHPNVGVCSTWLRVIYTFPTYLLFRGGRTIAEVQLNFYEQSRFWLPVAKSAF